MTHFNDTTMALQNHSILVMYHSTLKMKDLIYNPLFCIKHRPDTSSQVHNIPSLPFPFPSANRSQ